MVRFVLSLTIVLVATGMASARNLFVNNLTGNDQSDASAPEPLGAEVGPVRSITKALFLAQKGDRVVLANTGEPYRECVTMQAGYHSGWPDSPFMLEGNGATLDGSTEVPDHAWEQVEGDIYRFQPSRTAYQQLFYENLPLERAPVTSFGTFPDLKPLQWCLIDQHVYFRTEPTRLPQSYELTHSDHRVGITLYQVRHVVVQDLIIQGYQLDGINCHSNVHDGSLVGITARGNGRSGVSIGGASRVTLAASLVGNNGAAQLRAEGYAQVVLINNNLLENTAPAIVNDGATVTRREADPLPAKPAPEAAPAGDPFAVPNAAPAAAPPAESDNPFGF